jgi:signal transduction histidine kinase
MLIVILALALLVITAQGFQVFSVAPGRPENRAFAVFSWLLALWVVNDLFFWGFHGPNEDGKIWAQTAFVLAIAIQLAFLWFTWVFPVRRTIRWGRVFLFGIPVYVSIGLVLSGHVLGEARFVEGQFVLELTPVTYFVGFVIYVLFFLGRHYLSESRKRITSKALSSQIDNLLLAAWITSALTNFAGILLPLLGIYSLLPYFSIGILLGTVIHAYAVLNFRLFQPASLLDRVRLFPVTAKLSLSVSVTSFLTVVLVLGVARLFTDAGNEWKRILVLGLVVSSVPAMVLIFLVQMLVTRPLRLITEAALRVADGEHGVRVSVGTRDEAAVLASTFNDMVGQLEQDMEEMRKMSEGMLRSERLATAGVLAAGVAHEVNNPLAAMSSLVQLVQSHSDEKDQALLAQALDQMDRIAVALKDLMDLARPKEEQRRFCKVNEIVENTLRLLRYDKRFRKVSLSSELSAALPQIELDVDRIQQVLMNLLINAQDGISAKSDGCIKVATSFDDRFIFIKVIDNGAGIAEDIQSQIFEPFFTTKAAGSGTGLGLAVCRGIVQAHEGTLKLISKLGAGTTFILSLPRSQSDVKNQV